MINDTYFFKLKNRENWKKENENWKKEKEKHEKKNFRLKKKIKIKFILPNHRYYLVENMSVKEKRTKNPYILQIRDVRTCLQK